ncbi:MAG: hypothetical protein ACE5MM_02290 [Nitrospiraceae bacterium]
MLTEKDKRFLQRASTRYRYAVIIGFALALAGGLYGIWGVQQLDPDRAPNPGEAFDRPIAQLAILAARYEEWLNQVEPQTEREETLLKQLEVQTDMIVRVFLALFRFLFASMIITAGVVFIAIGLTQKQFLDIIKKVQQT